MFGEENEMIDYKKFKGSFANAYSDAIADSERQNECEKITNTEEKDVSESAELEKSMSAEENLDSEKVADDLPIYEATLEEINWWHAFGSMCELQRLLQEYGLGFGSLDKAYDRFKIGYNEEGHFASFAIDDTHYYKIQFTEYDGEPIDRQEAKKVLEKINTMRDFF